MFIQTRKNVKENEKVSFTQAILNPSASFGGLYVPESLPNVSTKWLEENKNISYKELCFKILKLFKIDVEDEILKEAISLYDNFDDKNDPVPLVKIGDKLYSNELYHGPTRAFKDMALQPFGHILSHLAQKNDQTYLILVATSGDTGPACLQTFKDKKNIKVVCMYPDGGTSDVQRLQMVTNDGKNVKVIGIKGNFDDAQKALKSLLNSSSFKQQLQQQNISLSAANSVNFGRIILQIVYHFSAYLKLLNENTIKNNEQIYLSIPSGNFGNALGAYYAKKMGLPIKKILIASNINNILTDLITKGVYDLKDRKLLLTTSPAMDILISSNVERILFDKFGADICKEKMDSLQKDNFYKLDENQLKSLQEDFSATFCDDEFAVNTIKTYIDNGYILDPHTATCIKTQSLKEDELINVITSTAQWTKFAPTMAMAIDSKNQNLNDLQAIKIIQNSLHVKPPKSISELFEKEQIHTDVIDKNDIEQNIIQFLKA